MSAAARTGRTRFQENFPAEPRNWEEINERLAYLGETERQIRALEDGHRQKVAVLKQQWLEAGQPVERERERLLHEIERFYWAHRGELQAQGRKSVELAFGRLGSRRSRSVAVEDAAAAQQWLAANGLERYLRTRTELDREAIRSALLSGNGESAELLRCPAIRLRELEEFWCEVDRTQYGSAAPPARAAGASNKNRRAARESSGRAPVSTGGSHELSAERSL